MRVGVVGSRSITTLNLEDYLPEDTTTIVSGGARGVDTCARQYARAHGIPLLEFLPDYDRYGRSAPLRRNVTIVENSDFVLAFWDGKSRGTMHTVGECERQSVPCRIVKIL